MEKEIEIEKEMGKERSRNPPHRPPPSLSRQRNPRIKHHSAIYIHMKTNRIAGKNSLKLHFFHFCHG